MSRTAEDPSAPVGPPRAWQRMLSGRRLDLLAPDPCDVDIVDIAHGLARVARWNGQTEGRHAFSVAQHSVLVLEIAVAYEPTLERSGRLATLLHDAPEYVIGDLISPFKSAIGERYRTIEAALLGAIHARYGLPHPVPAPLLEAIKRADRLAAYFEATRIAGFSESEARLYFGRPEGLPAAVEARIDAALEPVETAFAQTQFLHAFEALAQA